MPSPRHPSRNRGLLTPLGAIIAGFLALGIPAAKADVTVASGYDQENAAANVPAHIKNLRIKKEIEEAGTTGVAWNREESTPGIIAVATWAGKPSPSTPVISVSWPVFVFSEAKAKDALRCIRKLYPF